MNARRCIHEQAVHELLFPALRLQPAGAERSLKIGIVLSQQSRLRVSGHAIQRA